MNKVELEIEKAKQLLREAKIKTYPKEIQWLHRNQANFSTRSLERTMELPRQTLSNFFKNESAFKKKHWKKVIAFVKKCQKMD